MGEVGDEVEDLGEVSSGGGGPCDKKFLLRVKAGKTAVTLFFVAKTLFMSYEKMKKNMKADHAVYPALLKVKKVLFWGCLFRWGRSGGRGSISGRPAPPSRPFGPANPNLVSSIGETFKTFHQDIFQPNLDNPLRMILGTTF